MIKVAFQEIEPLYRLLRCGSTNVNPLFLGRLNWKLGFFSVVCVLPQASTVQEGWVMAQQRMEAPMSIWGMIEGPLDAHRGTR